MKEFFFLKMIKLQNYNEARLFDSEENEKHMFCSYILTIIESLRATIKKMYTLSQERQQKICDKSSKSFMSSCLFCFKIILDILIGIVLKTKESWKLSPFTSKFS